MVGAFRRKELRVLAMPLGEEDTIDADLLSAVMVEGAQGCALSYLNKLRVMASFGPTDGGCVFITSGPEAKAERERLSHLETVRDGFVLAELDLKHRGLRAFLGGRVANLPEFQMAKLDEHMALLPDAAEEAEAWTGDNGGWVDDAAYGGLIQYLQLRWGEKEEAAGGAASS